MFDRPSVTWAKKMFAILVENMSVIELWFVEKREMDQFLTHDIRGIPIYYDEEGRVWPNPLPYIIVAKEQ